MADLIDYDLTLYKLLTADTALMTATSNRVYGPPLGLPAGMSQAQAALVFASDGSEPHADAPFLVVRFTVYCYGATQTGARDVFRALYDVLHRRGRTEVTASTGVKHVLAWARLESGPADIPEPEIDYPRVVAAFRVCLRERTL